jgi:phosphoserine phosphatase
VPDPKVVLTPDAKVTVAEGLMERYGVAEDECVAYGDSASDIPLFRRLRNTVAVNGTDSLKAVAAASYDGTDLRGAYRRGRALFEERAAAGSRRNRVR